MPKKAGDVFETIAKHGVQTVELRFTDAAGQARAATVPVERLDAAALADGIVLDADLLVPDVESAFVDPFASVPALVLVCDRPGAAGDDPRTLAKRAEARLVASGLADALHVGCELRYYVFDGVAYENAPDATGYRLETSALREADEIRADVLAALKASGVEVVAQRALSPAQTALELQPRTLARAADAVTIAKHTVKTVAARREKSATFMPKPVTGAAGNDLRVHLSLLKDGKSPFFDKDGWSGASQTMLFFIGGLLAHAHSLLAICAPSANSYTRLRAAAEPLRVAFGSSRSATAVTVDAPGGREAKFPRIDFRAGDLSANPYLAFAALLCAGLDGVAQRVDPISAGYGPLDGGLPRTKAAAAKLRGLPPDLAAACEALERDRAYLTAGGVFTDEALQRWSEARCANEIAALSLRPHPYEFELSYDC